MALGDKIKEYRTKSAMSQEKMAEFVGVSRQAVTKWESGQTAPSTENLFKLAEIFGIKVDDLLENETGEKQSTAEEIYYLYKLEQEKKVAEQRKKAKKYILIFGSIALVLALIIGVIVYIKNLPVDWDAGACGGGYATYIFDKYEKELVQKFIDGAQDSESWTNVTALRGTQEAGWAERTIRLMFDIQYTTADGETITQSIHFIGERIWFDTFKWGGAIIEG
ncbi:MAG: helix-turn-helix domain-containing protein [Oscillospiraceae bacterium]|nr:helix-turn-helix domain-containing protein [Oscillospiraceae bacterium]